MALGKRKGLEPMLPILKYDARVGRFYSQDRVFDGSEWVSEQHDVTDGFRGIIDLQNAEAGWMRFPKGSPPEVVLFPVGPDTDFGDAPSKEHKLGVRLLVKLDDDEAGLRELLSTAIGAWVGVDKLHDAFLAEAAEHPGEVPVVEFVDSVENKSPAGVSHEPVFEIVEWVSRPNDIPAKPVPRPAPTTDKPGTKKARRSDLDDDIPY
jgi:hypothetical protein